MIITYYSRSIEVDSIKIILLIMGLTWHIYKTDIYERVASYSGINSIRSMILKLTIIFLKYELFLSKQKNTNKSNEQNINNMDDTIDNDKNNTNNINNISNTNNTDNTNNNIISNTNDNMSNTNNTDNNMSNTNNMSSSDTDINNDDNSDYDDENYKNVVLEDDISNMIVWLNEKKNVDDSLGYSPIIYANISQSLSISLIERDLSGIYWFINMSGCEGMYSIGQVIDMKNAFEILQNFYISNKKNMSQFIKYEKNIKKNAHIYDINIDTLEYSFELLKILKKACECNKPIVQC